MKYKAKQTQVIFEAMGLGGQALHTGGLLQEDWAVRLGLSCGRGGSWSAGFLQGTMNSFQSTYGIL